MLTEFYCVKLCFLQSLLGFTGFSWVLLCFDCVLLGFKGFLLGFTGCFDVFKGSYWSRMELGRFFSSFDGILLDLARFIGLF